MRSAVLFFAAFHQDVEKFPDDLVSVPNIGEQFSLILKIYFVAWSDYFR